MTALAVEVIAQLVELNRWELADAVRPAPREIVEEVKPGSLKFEFAELSLPARLTNSKVKIWPKIVELERTSPKHIPLHSRLRDKRFLISLRILEREIALFVQRDLFVADQRDSGVGGGGTGGGSRRLLDPLRLCAGDTEHPNQPDEK